MPPDTPNKSDAGSVKNQLQRDEHLEPHDGQVTRGALSGPKRDTPAPLSWFEKAKFSIWAAYARVKWRKFGREDRLFLKRLEARGISIDVIWDIGASNGAWSFTVAHAFPQAHVMLFEPLASFDADYSWLLRNHLSRHANWQLYSFAIGSEAATATLYKDGPSYGSSLIASDFAKQNWTAVDVSVRSIDELIEEEGIEQPDVIKIDTQGFEGEILKGAGAHLAKSKVLLLETWLSRAYGPQTPLLDELIEMLQPHGFVLAEIHAGYCDPNGMMHSVDAFFLRTDVAVQYGMQFFSDTGAIQPEKGK